ncbi:MAG: hypothetical protein D6683_08725 [Actinomyces sp.]|nr:MAG: hypothetical protein D6683_08725 [Actinomyces sp.]
MIDVPAVGRGAAVAAVFVIPAVTVAALAGEARSGWALAAAALVVVGYLAGGAVAAAAAPSAPFRHGATADLALFVAVQGVVAVAKIAAGTGISPVALAFNSLLAASFGVVGAAARRRVPARLGHTGG